MIYRIKLQGFKYLGCLGAFSLGILQTIVFSGSKVSAQNIVPDNTLGNENSIVVPLDSNGLPIDAISGGAIRGKNLFHSFQEFNIAEGRGTYFLNTNNNLENILTRVTGNNPSNILGTIGILNTPQITSNPNLFLINPNGIVFGENASLDVGGSFVGTTANGIVFGEQGFFSASEPETPQLLTVSPSAFLFNQIANQSVNSIESQAFLSVPTGKSLLLVGGNTFPSTASTGKILLNGGRLRASGGRIEIGGLGETGKINLNTIDNNFSLGFPEGVKRVDVSLLNLAEVDVTAGGGGDISIYGQNIDILEGSDICAGIGADPACGGVNQDNGSTGSQAGDIKLDALEKITIANPFSEVKNLVNLGSVGNSGDINIKADSLSVSNESNLLTNTFGEGNGGNITIETLNKTSFENNSRIISGVTSEAVGEGGEIRIKTKFLLVNNGSEINANTFGNGNAGNIFIEAYDEVVFDNGDAFSNTGAFRNVNLNEVDAGNININTGSLFVINGAQLITINAGTGKAGNINIKAEEQVLFAGTNSNNFSSLASSIVERGGIGKGGDINISTGSLSVIGGAQLNADSRGRGDAGNIIINARENVLFDGSSSQPIFNPVTGNEILPSGRPSLATSGNIGLALPGDISINANQLIISNNAAIQSLSFSGDSGNVNIDAKDIQLKDGSITGEVVFTGNGGDINISGKNIRLQGDSNIRTNVPLGDGGNINLTADTIIALDDSDILSFARDGRGGDITFNTEGFFSSSQFLSTFAIADPNRLNGNNRVDINASGTISGNITGIPDTTFIQNSLNELPENQIDTNALISQTCIARSNDTGSTFNITGSSGFPHSPGNADISNYPTNSVRGVPKTTSGNWKKGDPIIEPDGVYRLPDGKIVLAHKCL